MAKGKGIRVVGPSLLFRRKPGRGEIRKEVAKKEGFMGNCAGRSI